MSLKPPRVSSTSHVSPRRADGSRGRSGPHLGRIRITPTRAVFALAFAGSLGYIVWAILMVKDSAQIPMVASGVAVQGLIFASLSIGSAIRMWRAWQEGRQGQTIVFAMVGGITGLIAIGYLTGTLVLALVWGS